MSDEYITLEVEFKTCTKNAVLVSYNDVEDWLPRSCLRYDSDRIADKLSRGDTFQLTAREWALERKGFI